MANRSSITVRFNEIDPYRHVNHAVYLTYLEVGRTEALEATGIPIERIADEGFQLVITRVDVRFRGPARLGERLEVVTTLAEARRASQVWHQQIVRPGPDQTVDLLVEADVTIAVTDAIGRPTRPPQWLATALGAL